MFKDYKTIITLTIAHHLKLQKLFQHHQPYINKKNHSNK